MPAKPFFDFKIEGAKELDRVLKNLPKATGKAQLKVALRRSAKPLVQQARAKAPKRTGAGAKSIKAFTMTRTRVSAAIAIGPDEEHWYMVFPEFGTFKDAAQPFLRPTWDATKEGIARSFVKNVWYVLDRMAKKFTKQAYAGKLSKAGRKALRL